VRRREAEVARVLDILLRHGKNNPVLVGDAGVGKTAIAEAVAQRIADGDVPHTLRDMRVLALDHVGLLAGTTFRGQYEERIRAIVEETTTAGDVVLFIDELHNLMGQGTALGAAMDAANMLKPALVRGDFRVIGATTGVEYERWIRPDPALERRFQMVVVRELGTEATLEILHARAPILERHHDVVVHESAVLAAVRLSDMFMQDRRRPDRALDALDEACAHAQGIARLSAATEALARERRRLLRNPSPDGWEATRQARQAQPSPDEPRGDYEAIDFMPDVRVELPEFARDGFAALERFGTELGSLFDGSWIDPDRSAAEAPDAGGAGSDAAQGTSGSGSDPDASGSDTPAAGNARSAQGARQAAPDEAREAPGARQKADVPGPRREASRSLAELDAELRVRLIDEGVVVRGHDVARVIGLVTGKSITWVD